MTTGTAICRIGVFYDGNYFLPGARYFYYQLDKGWPQLKGMNALIEEFVSKQEQGLFQQFKVVHAAWFQGRFHGKNAPEDRLRLDRNTDFDLMHAGVEAHFFPMAGSGKQDKFEKGIDVALALEALEVGLSNTVDVIALIAGDGDFIPLVRKLMRKGIRSLLVYFDFPSYTDSEGKERGPCFANPALVDAVNYSLNLSSEEKQKEYRAQFATLFRKKGDS